MGGGFEGLAIACLYGDSDKRSGLGRRERTPNRTALLLEAIVLHHRIAVLECSRTRRRRFRRIDPLRWILPPRWWAQWRESPIIVQPETVLRWRRRGWVLLWINRLEIERDHRRAFSAGN